jgi:CheY-like chemotaxis protein
VIDDDKEFIKIIEKYFEKIGDIELITSLDSKDAISKVLFFKPDLLIIDYYLPKANGRIIKDTFDFMLDYKIPTIFVSANNQSQLDLKKYLENPCVGFMQKPLGFVAFKDLVHQMLYDPNIKKHEVKMNSPQKTFNHYDICRSTFTRASI